MLGWRRSRAGFGLTLGWLKQCGVGFGLIYEDDDAEDVEDDEDDEDDE